MGEVLETWLRDRLGLIIDLDPDNFGLTTRDGTLMAQLLHSYDIIDNTQLNTIIETEDPALARVNLKHLRVWLKFIGVDCDDDTIEDISNGRGATAARLFYKIFVSLESKDKLHFITQQKEREKFVPNSSKFDVTTVPERPPTPESSGNPLAEPLIENATVIAWHRKKFEAILERCKLARQRCMDMQNGRNTMRRDFIENVVREKHESLVDRVTSVEKEMQDLEDFTERHKVRCTDEYTYDDLYNEKKLGEQLKPVPVDLRAAKLYVKCMKDRTRRAMASFSCKNRMEKALTSKLWEKQRQDQETKFDEAIVKKLFSQSQYEKQITTKLCEIRDQKRRFARNRGVVETLMQERMKSEHDMELARERELVVKESQDVQAECLRLCELHKRIAQEKIRLTQKKHYGICKTALDDLIDISLKAVDYRENNENFIPTKVWNEWKVSFVKSQPVFEKVERTERVADGEDEENTEEILEAEIEKQEILNEADFDDYLNVRPPWDEFMPEIDLDTQEILRLGNIVLGYIVHRLLEYINPLPSDPVPAPVPKVSSACILLGVLDPSVYPIMQALLNHRGVKLLHMEDAINYCLLRYKEEMKESAYIDLEILNSKNQVQPKKNVPLEKQGTLTKTPKLISSTKGVVDEQTQTPRALPNDDMSPDLSDPAFIGKWIHEYLSVGQPIPNELNTRLLIEYLRSLKNVKGWVLVDYPNTVDQMAGLETALTGLKVPLKNDVSSDDIDDEIEEMDPAFSGISYEAGNEEEISVLRESRLVCNPIPKNMDNNFKSYMTAYMRAIPKPKDMRVDETDIYEILPEDTTPLDSFYADQGLAYAVYYTSFNMPTLKRLCRLAIGDMSIPRVPSEELFGDVLSLLEDGKNQPPPSKAPIIKQLIPGPDSENMYSREESDYEGEGADALNDIVGEASQHLSNSEPISAKPGEDGWDWIKFPQSRLLLEALGTLWENMETVYIGDLKEIFFMKRVGYSNIVPYRNYAKKLMADFIQRPDFKQDMLHSFHTSYNEIANEMRDNLDVKCELHCRVADFRKELWEICDDRRRQAEEERQRIICQGWTAEEMIILANLYISIIKAEIDRCVDTLQLVQDYYISMLQRPIAAARLPKYPLHRLELNTNEITISNESLSPVTVANKPSTKVVPSSRNGKNMTQTAPIINCNVITKQIADLLIIPDNERQLLAPVEITCYRAVHSNVTYVQSIVESLASSMFEILNKEEASFTPDAKGRVQIRKAQLSPTANDEIMSDVTRRGLDLCHEWRYAVQFEINRLRLRLKLLDNAALSDVSFLYETMKGCFHNIFEDINDRYNREIKSVNDMASVFCSAIEEGVPIQEELLLDGDRFVVRSNVLMYPDDPIPTPLPIQEAILPLQFRMGQLGRLMDVFRYIAPHGSLSERCFTYIIEDIIACRENEVTMPYLPSSWFELAASDVSDLVSEIFGGSEYVDWREFIIYAMDIPMPSENDILDARAQFMAMDPNLTEMVTRDQFHSVNMWFSNCQPKDSCGENFGRAELQKDGQETSEKGEWSSQIEENSPSTTIPTSESSHSCKKSLTNSTFSFNSRNMTPQETVRLMLAKEMLCDMFAQGCNAVNYTAFLLACSKDCDPKKGFGKALALALGAKVCVLEEEGEEFVAKLLEQKRVAAAEETVKRDERETAVKNVSSLINDVLNTTLQLTEGITITEIDGLRKCGNTVKSVARSPPDQDIRIVYLDTESPSNTNTSQSDFPVSSTLPPSRSKDSRSYDLEHDISTATILATGYSRESLGVIDESVIVHWIPKDVCLSVLVASLPWHARQPDILETTCCIRECLDEVYLNILDTTISDEENYVLSHRLLNHDFIKNVLTSTTAFTMKNIANLVQIFLNRRFSAK